MAKQRPAPEELTQLSEQKGMTFPKMAHLLEVDRKTIKRWCLDVGIKEVGVKQPIGDPQDEKPLKSIDINKDQNDTKAIGSIRPDALSRGLAAIDLEAMEEKDCAVTIEEIAYKLYNGIPVEKLEKKEAKLLISLMDIIVMTMKPDIDLIHQRISRHYHTTLSVESGKHNSELYQERRVAR